MLSPRYQLASGAEALLLRLRDVLGDVARHRAAEQQLAVARALEEALSLEPGLVLVGRTTSSRLPSLRLTGTV